MVKSKIEIIGERLKRVAESLRVIKALGFDEDLLVAWLCHNLKISEKKAKQIIASEEDFLNRLIKEEVVKSL